MYRLKLTTRAKKELKSISIRHRLSLSNIFEEIKENPLIGKPLSRDLTERYTYRVGVYRIIYKINKSDKIISIITAGHRSKIYD